MSPSSGITSTSSIAFASTSGNPAKGRAVHLPGIARRRDPGVPPLAAGSASPALRRTGAELFQPSRLPAEIRNNSSPPGPPSCHGLAFVNGFLEGNYAGFLAGRIIGVRPKHPRCCCQCRRSVRYRTSVRQTIAYGEPVGVARCPTKGFPGRTTRAEKRRRPPMPATGSHAAVVVTGRTRRRTEKRHLDGNHE